ncbi:cholecystokinin receptor type A [Drosophila novamexicana]|uniref:cholecystokinin receptor type A n=1 Tax=Drosophila novamexicana TaxID=47314 RepID=UPI0011E5EDCE|nr:cholecystokinin receptor type A [Drosophila novamexicana]
MASDTASATVMPTPLVPSNRSMSRVIADVPIWVIPCYSIILLCAVVGNLLVVLTLVQNRRMRTITNVFLLNLAISDILLGVLCMPVTLVGTLLRNFIFGETLCKLIQFAQAASVAVSSWTLVAISCERYYAICHPLRSRTWQTINHANKIIAFIWLGSLVCMTPIAIFSQLMPTSRQGLRKCREQWPANSLGYERAYNIFLNLALLVLPLMALSFAYLFITRTLYVSMRNERAMNFGSSGPDVGLTTNSSSSNNNSSCTGIRRTYGNSNYLMRMQMRQEALAIDGSAKLDMLLQQQKASGPPQYYYDITLNDLVIRQKQIVPPCKRFYRGLLLILTCRIYGSPRIDGHRVFAADQANVGHAFGVCRRAGQFDNLSCGCHTLLKLDLPPAVVGALHGGAIDQIHQAAAVAIVEYALAAQECVALAQSRRSAAHQIVWIQLLTLGKAEGYTQGGSKRRLFGSCDGRRHLYCMRSASVKSLRQQQQQQQHLGGSGDCCARMQRMRQQQLNMTAGNDGERRKSLSTPSLRITEATLRRSNETKSLESKKRVVKMLFVLVLEFFICWTPLYVINTMTMLIGPVVYEYVDYTAISFLQLLAYSSSCCNPITYCFMNASFRRAFVDTFKGMRLCDGGRFGFCRRRSKNETNLSVAGNSIALANSAMSSHTILESPRL